MIQQFTFDGAGRQIDARGVTFRYESGTDASGITDLKLWIDGNAVGTLSPGDLLELPMEGKRWEVKPVSPTCYGVVKVGIGKITTTKVAGVVSTVDGGKARSMAGLAFAGYGFQAGSTGSRAVVQLWNKSANKTLVVNAVSLSSSAALNIQVGIVGAAVGSVFSNGLSKGSGMAASTNAELRAGLITPASLLAASSLYKSWVSSVAGLQEWRMTEPIAIPPGKGIQAQAWSDNADIQTSFEWFEEAI
jgi:hypothetical protein